MAASAECCTVAAKEFFWYVCHSELKLQPKPRNSAPYYFLSDVIQHFTDVTF